MSFLHRAEFYITNVCNYNCEQCNRFNNYRFTGHQLWNNYASVYRDWGDKIEIGSISILGGEPLLNPSINTWITGIKDIWKTTHVEIVTNGTRLNKVKDLYNTIKQYDGQVFIHIGLHDRDQLSDTINNVLEFLDTPIVNTKVYPDNINELWQLEYNKLKYIGWPECNTPDEFATLPQNIKDICAENDFSVEKFLLINGFVGIIDKNKVRVEIHIEDVFHQSALMLNDNKFTVNHSNPENAHSICFEKHNHHFVHGKLYKCNVSAVLPMFYDQFNVDLSDEDKNIMDSYVPLESSSTNLEIEKFIGNLPNSIPQCTFCPEFLNAYRLNPSTLKPKVIKKHK